MRSDVPNVNVPHPAAAPCPCAPPVQSIASAAENGLGPLIKTSNKNGPIATVAIVGWGSSVKTVRAFPSNPAIPAGCSFERRMFTGKWDLAAYETAFYMYTHTDAAGKAQFTPVLPCPGGERYVGPQDVRNGGQVRVWARLSSYTCVSAPGRAWPVLEARKVFIFPSEEQKAYLAKAKAAREERTEERVADAPAEFGVDMSRFA